MLTAAEQERYVRQLRLPQVGPAGQEALKRSRVLVVGAGGLGSPALLYLAAAGVGTLGIVDSDVVDASNLQRQVLFSSADIGQPKAEAAARRLRDLNPEIQLLPWTGRLAPDNAGRHLAGYDFVLDATDNFASKFLVNDACVQAGIPFCHAGILAFSGQLLTVLPGKSACYRCLFADPPPATAADQLPAGPLGAVPGVIGTLQAGEALKCLLGCGDLLVNRMLTFDLLRLRFREIAVTSSPDCPACRARSLP